MSSINFPNPKTYAFPPWVRIGDYFYKADDIIYFGGDLTTENLRNSYTRGIFPWTIEGLPLPWFCPERRAILEFADLHISGSLRRAINKKSYTFTVDQAFEKVIRNCSRVFRPHEKGTWITEEFIAAYTDLHREGMAHSVEAWEGDVLVGGVYGVDCCGVFAGESMFHLKPNASKLALLHLIEHLSSRGATWLDIQVMTPHMQALGAKEIPRADFLEKLEATQHLNLNLFSATEDAE